MSAIDDGNKAKAVLDNPVYQAAYEAVRQAIYRDIGKLPIESVEAAEKLRMCLKVLSSVQANMVTALNGGKIEAFKLEEEKKRRDNPLRSLFR